MLNYEKCPSYAVGTRVVDSAGVTINCALEIRLNDVNDPPVLESNPVREVEEGAELETQVGTEIGASDEDRMQELLFSITSGNDAGFFKISRCSGQISVIKAGLDYETTNVRQMAKQHKQSKTIPCNFHFICRLHTRATADALIMQVHALA